MVLASLPHLTDHFLDVFNCILTRGKFRKPWNVNTLSPLHKKGLPTSTEITEALPYQAALLKYFLSKLHNRLYKFVHTKELIPPNQIGYKKGPRTTDHILTLKISLINTSTLHHVDISMHALLILNQALKPSGERVCSTKQQNVAVCVLTMFDLSVIECRKCWIFFFRKSVRGLLRLSSTSELPVTRRRRKNYIAAWR